jgi:hypothetical protein
MEIKRKLQLVSAAIIANGLLAFTVLSPRPALAASCSPIIRCGACSLLQCQVWAPPGCTAIGTTSCSPPSHLCQSNPDGDLLVKCAYQ